MTPERWSIVDALLQAALERAPTVRSAFVAQECAGDAELQREVESLLAAEATAGDFLERPAHDPTAFDAEWTLTRLSAVLAGRYVLERELGRGGMATVYLARDLRHKRLVALKVLHQALGTLVGPSRFRREIETAAGLSHPHILPLYDSGGDVRDSSGGRLLYYVMPYVAGGSLRELLQREGRLAERTALRIVREVATALDYAHRHGVVHRDIKPENILLAEDGDALVADFGIARALQRATAEATGERTGIDAALLNDSADTLSQWGVVVGTPAYMSPEQALGGEIDGRSDQYALGCVAFEVLAGARPFSGSSAEQIAQRPTQKPPSLAALRPELPPAVDTVLIRALAPVADERFDSATALAEALIDALAVPRERAAGGVDRSDRAPTAHRRLRRSTGALAAIAVAAVGGTFVFRAQTIEASRAREMETTRPAATDTVDKDAFDLYVRGARLRSGGPDGISPTKYFAAAIAKDSTFAPAYAALAFEYAFSDAAEARRLVNKALTLDPTLAEAHMALGVIRQFRDFDWEGSEAALREAIRLNGGFAEAHLELSMLLMRRRRFGEALGEAQRTLYLAPMSARFEMGMGEVYFFSGRYAEALKSADKALAIDPRNVGPYLLRASVFVEQQSYAKAAEAAQQCVAFGCGVYGRAKLGLIHARSGRRPQALKLVDSLQREWREAKGPPTDRGIAIGIAQVYLGLGERERALDWIERSVGREMYAVYLNIDPAFRSLRAEPRFREVLKRLRLVVR